MAILMIDITDGNEASRNSIRVRGIVEQAARRQAISANILFMFFYKKTAKQERLPLGAIIFRVHI